MHQSNTEDASSSQYFSPPSRPLVARVRLGTHISGGIGWASGSTISGARDTPIEVSPDGNLSGSEESDLSSDERDSERRGHKRTASQEREDDERAEAKSNRKIADLEITTRSLLSINTTLEATKVRQAREIRDLRRKLRETRLAMPPKRFKLLSKEDVIENEEIGDNEGDESDDFEEEQEKDECFLRVKNIIEDLLTVGRNALAAPAPSFGVKTLGSPSGGELAEGEVLTWVASPSGDGANSRNWKHGVAIGSRVLTADEAKKWTGHDEDDHEANKSHTDTVDDEQEVERQVGNEDSDDAHSATTQEDGSREDTLTTPP